MDITINPGPKSAIPQHDGHISGNINHNLDFKLGGSSRSSTSHLHTVTVYSTELCYSHRELLNICRVCSKTVTSEVLSLLKWAGVLKYRGRKAGRRRIPVVITTRNMNRRYLNRTIVKKNLVNIELQKDSTVSQHLQFTLFNTRSIDNKAMYLKDFVVDHEIDLLALTETWLDSMDNQTPNTINELCPSGYALIHVPWLSDTHGGGVGLLYNKCYKMEQQQHVPRYSSFKYMETLLRSPTTVLRIDMYFIDLHHPHKTGSLFLCFSMNFQLCLNT